MSKRSLWGNVVEFFTVTKGYFKSHQMKEQLETDYKRRIAKQMLEVNTFSFTKYTRSYDNND